MANQSAGPAQPVRHDPSLPRIDAPHAMGGRASPPVVPAGGEQEQAVVAEVARHAAEQVQQQAVELGDHLRRRQRELVQREANLHAQVAQWEDEQRANRLWVQQRAIELAEREAELNRREAEWDERHRELVATRSGTAAPHQRPAESPAEAGGGGPAAEAVARLHALLRQQLDRVQQQHEAMVQEQQAWRERTRKQRSRLALHWQRRHQLGKTQAALLARRRQQLAERRAALVQGEKRLHQQQHELARNQQLLQTIWAGLREAYGSATIDELSRSSSELPAAGSSPVAETAAAQRDELHRLADQLARQRRELETRHTLLRRWIAQRQQELDRETAAREHAHKQLEDVEIRLAEARRDWFVQWQRECAKLEQGRPTL